MAWWRITWEGRGRQGAGHAKSQEHSLWAQGAAGPKVFPEGRALGVLEEQWSEVQLNRWPGPAKPLGARAGLCELFQGHWEAMGGL